MNFIVSWAEIWSFPEFPVLKLSSAESLVSPDAETAANRGYAFLNFLDPGSAWMLASQYLAGALWICFGCKVMSIELIANQLKPIQ